MSGGAIAGQPLGDERRVYCGVDVGASATKLVLVDEAEQVLGRVVRPSGTNYASTALGLLEQALGAAGMSREVARSVSTGYGRRNVEFADDVVTEIHCHGVGCYQHAPRRITVVDVGGQDNKVIRIGDSGQRLDFRMNRKCAAGTGAFLEEIAARLDLPLGELERLARSTSEHVKLSSFCTVFAKTEILSHLRAGVPIERIVRGAFMSVVTRVTEMDVLEGEVLLTGGVVAHNPTIADLLSEKIGHEVLVPPYPQFTGALGAALLAARRGPKTSPGPTPAM